MRRAITTAAELRERCRVDAQGHWHWRGARDGSGCPSLRFAPLAASVSLGVVACWLATGDRPKPGQVWHPVCGVRECANPAHRRAGDRRSQMQALAGIPKTAQTRLRMAAGRRKAGKLTDTAVAEIQAWRGPLAEIAERHGITVPYACELRKGRARPFAIAHDVVVAEVPSRLPPLQPRKPALGVFSALRIGEYMPGDSAVARAYGGQR